MRCSHWNSEQAIRFHSLDNSQLALKPSIRIFFVFLTFEEAGHKKTQASAALFIAFR